MRKTMDLRAPIGACYKPLGRPIAQRSRSLCTCRLCLISLYRDRAWSRLKFRSLNLKSRSRDHSLSTRSKWQPHCQTSRNSSIRRPRFHSFLARSEALCWVARRWKALLLVRQSGTQCSLLRLHDLNRLFLCVIAALGAQCLQECCVRGQQPS